MHHTKWLTSLIVYVLFCFAYNKEARQISGIIKERDGDIEREEASELRAVNNADYSVAEISRDHRFAQTTKF